MLALAYLVALGAAVVVEQRLSGGPVIVAFAAADAAATLAVFLVSLAVNNSSVYDPYWSVAPMVLAPAIALRGGAASAPSLRAIVVTALVFLWGARLTWNCLRGFHGLHQEDFRYVELRRTTGKAYWLVSLVGLHFMPTVMVYLGCWSLFPALGSGARALNGLDALGFVVTLGGIALEARADHELWAFRRTNEVPGKIIDTGLWAHSRHPNYLGEMLFWWGLFIFAMAADPGALWTITGPLAITSLFLFVSLPLMDKRSLARRPRYAEHMKRVPALVPRPWRSARGRGP